MITLYFRPLRERKLKKPKEFRPGSWVHAEAPTPSDLDRLESMLGVDRSLLKDSLDPYEVPRMEKDGGVVYIFMRYPFERQKEIRTEPILIAIGENFLLTVSTQHAAPLERFLKNEIDFSTTQKTKFLLQIFSAINQKYSRHLLSVSRRVRSNAVRPEQTTNKDIRQFVRNELLLNDFIADLVPASDTFEALLSGKYVKLYETDREYVEDIHLHIEQLIKTCRTTLKNIVNVRSAYSTIMTNNLNHIIRILTALTVMLTIPTIISSFFGMNVPVPFSDSVQGFGIILSGTVIAMSIVFLMFMRNKWL